MFENDIKEFEFNGVVYPYKCTMLVLEKIQQHTGDLMTAEDKLRGFRPKIDADGVMDRLSGTYTLPDIELVAKSLCWMIEEGIEITGSEIEPLKENDLKRGWRDEYSLVEVAILVAAEFGMCVSGKKKNETKTETKKLTGTKTRTKNS